MAPPCSQQNPASLPRSSLLDALFVLALLLFLILQGPSRPVRILVVPRAGAARPRLGRFARLARLETISTGASSAVTLDVYYSGVTIRTHFPFSGGRRAEPQNPAAVGVSPLGFSQQPAELRTFPAQPRRQPAQGDFGFARSMDGGKFGRHAGALAYGASRARTHAAGSPFRFWRAPAAGSFCVR